MRVTIDLMKKSTQIVDLSNVINPRVGDDDLQLPLHIGYGDNLFDMRGKDVEFLANDPNKKNIYIAGTCNTNTPGDNLYMGDLTFRFPAGTFQADGTYDPDKTMFRIVDKETQKAISSVNVKITVMKNNIEFDFDPDKTSYDSRLENMLHDFHDKGQSMLDEIKDLNNQAKSNVSGDTAATANEAKKQADQSAGDISDLKGEVAGARGRFANMAGREDAQDAAINQKESIANANANYAELKRKDAQQDAEIASKARQDFIINYLSKMNLQPEAFENEAALKATYPNGKSGLMVTADTGHKWLYVNGVWKDCGVYQAAGPDPEVQDAKVESSKLGGFTSDHLGIAIRDQINSVLALSGGESIPKTIKRSVHDYGFNAWNSCYISDYTIPANKTVKRIGFVSSGLADHGDPTAGFLIFMSAGNTVIYRQNLTGITKGWNEIDVNYKTLEPVFVGICVPGIRMNTSSQPIENYFSVGAHEIKPENADKVQVGYGPEISSSSDDIYFDYALQLDVVDSLNNSYQPVMSPNMNDSEKFPDALSSQQGSLYVSDYVYPAKATSVNVKFYTAGPSLPGQIYVLNAATNEVIDIQTPQPRATFGWREITFKASYPVDFKLAFYNLGIKFWDGKSLPSASDLYSPFEEGGGLCEGSKTDVGKVMTVTQTSANNYYFMLNTSYIADSDANETIDRLKYLVTNLTVKSKQMPANAKAIEAVSDQVKLLMNRRQMQLKLVENGDPFGFVGRWWTEKNDNKDYHMTNNGGSEVFFRTSGSETITPVWYKKGITTNVYYAYSIDNGPIHRALTGTAITIGDQQEHIVRLTVDGVAEGGGEKWSGNYAIGFGGLSEAVQTIGLLPHNPLIHFYGDSITEGIRALGITTTGDMGDTNSATNSYSYLTAKKLTAAPYLVGYGASGIEATGSFNTLINTMGNLYNGKQVDKREPDLIVVNMGTNDAGTAAQQFSNDYKTAINRLRILYPGVQIACMVPFNQTHAKDIASAISGIPECSLIDTEGWAADMEFADGTHPTAKGAEVASDKLAQALINNGLI